MSREQDVMHLFKNVDINDPEMLQMLLFKNFAEIESHMQVVQGVLKSISGGSIIDVTAKIEQSFADISAALIAAAAAQEAADGKIQGFFQNDEPTTNMGFGDIWIDTNGATPLDESCIYRYEDENGGSQGELAWRPSLTSAVGLVYLKAYLADSHAYDAMVNNSLYIQYSPDGEDWHNVFDADNDMYMRQKVGDNGEWSDAIRIRGEDGYTPIKGTDYFDGVDGQSGTSAYIWVRYSQNANGNPMTDVSTNAKYIGIASTTIPTAPTGYASYLWSLIKGTDGIPGEAGADGQTSYLHIKYSDDGETFTANNGETSGAWIGTYVDFTQADSLNFSDYTWNKIRGEDGQDVAVFTSQPNPPYAVGDLWVESNNDTKICVVSKAADGAFEGADWQETAATKITTFYQSEIPISKAVGDFWIDIDDNNKMYRAASQGADAITPGEWEPVRDLGVTRSAATYIIADEATSNNAKNADYIVPAGSTSAQEVINEAINALPADGGKVLLLEGTYLIDGSISIPSNVTLEGQGKNTVIRLGNNIAATFVRNSIAHKQDGSQVASGAPRYEAGKFGQGIMVEEALTNLLTANQSDIETDITGFSKNAYNTGRLTRDTSVSRAGSACLKWVASNSSSYHGIRTTGTFLIEDGESFAASVYVRGSGSAILGIANNGGAWLAQSSTALLSDSWQRITTIYKNTSGSSRYVNLEVAQIGVSSPSIFYMDCFSASKNSYHLTWQVGSTPRNAEVLTIPTAGTLEDNGPWTISCWVKGNNNSILPGECSVILSAEAKFSLGITASTNKPVLSWTDGVQQSIEALSGIADLSGLHHWALVFNGTTAFVYVDGAKVITADTIFPRTFPANLTIGSMGEGSFLNGVIDDLRIDAVALSDAEILEIYNSEQPLPKNANTAAKFSFDGTLDEVDNSPIMLSEMIVNQDKIGGNHSITIASLSIDGNGNPNISGISFNRVTKSNVIGCQIENSRVGLDFYLSDENSISNNLVNGNTFAGIYFGGCSRNTLIGNFVQYNYNHGLSIYSDMRNYPDEVKSFDNTIMGSVLSNNGGAGLMFRGHESTVSGNTFTANGYGGIELGGNMNTVSNNISKTNGDEGIYFYGSHNVVSGNVCSENSQSEHNVYANIALTSGGSYNSIQNNNCRQGSLVKKPKYGIGILDSVCERTMVTNNDLYTGGVTASFYDGGTGTKTTATNRT